MDEVDESIFKIEKDKNRAKDLFAMANERLRDIISILPNDKPYKIIEEYYEIITQLITSLMYADGCKTLSHVSLIKYLEKNYRGLNKAEINLIDTLRRNRHGAVYYGKKIKEDFLINNRSEIERIIRKLNKIIKEKIE